MSQFWKLSGGEGKDSSRIIIQHTDYKYEGSMAALAAADVVILMRSNGDLDVIKNRFGTTGLKVCPAKSELKHDPGCDYYEGGSCDCGLEYFLFERAEKCDELEVECQFLDEALRELENEIRSECI